MSKTYINQGVDITFVEERESEEERSEGVLVGMWDMIVTTEENAW